MLRVLGLGFVLLIGCQPAGPVQSQWRPSPPVVEPDPPPVAVASSSPETVAQMHALLGGTEILRAHAARGDTQALKVEAQAFARSLQDADTQPGAWKDPLELIRAEVAAIAHAGDDATTAQSLAVIARTCGDCHGSIDAELAVAATLKRGPAPSVGTTDAEAMLVHRWATGQMWDSLIVPDPDRWVQGTTMFVVLPTCGDRPDMNPDQVQRCRKAQAIARRAHLEDGRARRAALMGELLSTCAPCHRAANAP